jgi:hypothetical protein
MTALEAQWRLPSYPRYPPFVCEKWRIHRIFGSTIATVAATTTNPTTIATWPVYAHTTTRHK